MDLQPIIRELREERDRIDQAIAALTAVNGGVKRRGRPPKWLQQAREQEALAKPVKTTAAATHHAAA